MIGIGAKLSIDLHNNAAENRKLKYIIQDDKKELKMYKDFLHGKKQTGEYEKYKKDIDVYDDFVEAGWIRRKDHQKNKYYVYEKYGDEEIEYDLPYISSE